MSFPPWKWLPPSARRNYLAAGVVLALLWVALATLVALPPSSPVLAVPLLFLPIGLVVAVMLLRRGMRLGQAAMQSRFPGGAPKRATTHSLQGGGMEISSESTQSGQRGSTAVAEYLRGAESLGIKAIQTMTGVDISDHTPGNLRLIDAVADERFRATLLRRGEIESASIAFGTYLGEVFVRNLGGDWHYPSWLQAVMGSISRDPFRAERDCYISLRGQRVFVFKAARDTIEETSAVFSLFEFYSGWAKAVGVA